jgi:hypothetical protein
MPYVSACTCPMYLLQILRAYLEQFICEAAVTSEGCGARPLPGTRLAIPSSSNPLDYSTLIESLPESDSPALFGLPANINRAAGRAASAAVVAQLKRVTTSQVSLIISFLKQTIKEQTRFSLLEACQSRAYNL